MMITNHFNYFLVSFPILKNEPILKFKKTIKFIFLHFPFHLFPPIKSIFQLLTHPSPNFLFLPQMLFRYLSSQIKIQLNSLNKRKFLMKAFILFLYLISIDTHIFAHFEFGLKMP